MVHGAVHRLQVVVLAGFAHLAVLVEFGVDVHGREHAVRVPLQVARGDVEVLLGDVRGVDELVAGLFVLAPGVVLQLLAHDPALGVEHRQTGPQLVGEAEQVQFDPELAVIAALGLLDQFEVAVQGLLRLPRGAVHPLQAGVVLVAAPVCGTAAGQLERRDEPGGRNVRAAAQVAPDALLGARIEVVVGGQLVPADLHDIGVPGLVVDQFQLERLAGKFLAGLLFGLIDTPGEHLAVLDDLGHPLFELGQVFGRERLGDVEVVVEPVGDRRADTELCLWEQVLHRLGEHMRAGMPDDAAAVLGVGGDGLDVHVDVGDPVQVAQPALGVAHHDDGIGCAALGQSRLAHRRPCGGPGSDPEQGCGGGTGGGGHRWIS